MRGLKEKVVGPSIGFYLPHLFFRYGLSKTSGSHGDHAYPFLKNVPKVELERLARDVFADRLLPRIDTVVAERIRALQKNGNQILIASSSFSTILEPLAGYLGIDGMVASEFEFRDGMATGRVAGEPAFGEGKRSRVLACLKAKGLEPADCAFYTDSFRDLPLLREVGEAVAVNPGRRLRGFARDAGWEILTT